MKKEIKSKLFFFPSEPMTGYQNPYCNYYKEALLKYYKVLDMDRGSKFKRMFTLPFYSFKCDIIIFNWLESVPFFAFGKVQFYVNLIALFILRLRKVKILFMFHDLVSHFGDNWMSRYLMRWLFKYSDVIISHSKEAAQIALNKSKSPSFFISHPIKKLSVANYSVDREVDVFIWGAVYNYKGVYEFISQPSVQNSKLKILIMGIAKDEGLSEKIRSCCNDHIFFDERRADFDEIAAYCKASRYVLFPYIGESVSSSGALIDTLVFGGTPVGPNRGSFQDLASEGMCFAYNNYDELLDILLSKSTIDNCQREVFINEHSWEKIADFIHDKIGF